MSPFCAFFHFPPEILLIFVTKTVKVKREGLRKRRQCSWTRRNNNDLEKKVKKVATPFYVLIAIFGVGQILKTKESIWVLGGGKKQLVNTFHNLFQFDYFI